MLRGSAVACLLAAAEVVLAQPGDTPSGRGRGGKRQPSENPGWLLSQHSFETTLTYDDNLEHWLCSAGTMPLRDRVQLMPPVSDRHGFFWHRRPLTTLDFEASFTLNLGKRTPGDPMKGNADGHFAFWLGPDDFAAKFNEASILNVKDWNKGLEEQGLKFAGNKPDFRGLGVVFLSRSRAEAGVAGESGPSISAIFSDGTGPAKTLYSDLPMAKGSAKTGMVQSEYLDWHNDKLLMKVRVSAAGIVGSVLIPPANSYQEIFKLDKSVMPTDWAEIKQYFVGFSGWTGSSTYQEVNINRFEMRNFDAKHKGEDMTGVLEKGDEDPWLDVLASEARLMDQRSQKEAVEKLTSLLGDYVERYNKVGEQVKGDLLGLEDRMQSLESNFKNEISAISAWNMDTGEFDVNVVKEHLTGIRKIIAKDKETHDTKFEKVAKVTEDLKSAKTDALGERGRQKVKEVAEISKALEAKVSSGSSQTSFLLFLMVATVAGLGALFLKRMRYYEKKHYI